MPMPIFVLLCCLPIKSLSMIVKSLTMFFICLFFVIFLFIFPFHAVSLAEHLQTTTQQQQHIFNLSYMQA